MPIKLDKIATPLADINELSTLVNLLNLLKIGVSPDVKQEYDKASNIKQVITELNRKKRDEDKIDYEGNKKKNRCRCKKKKRTR